MRLGDRLVYSPECKVTLRPESPSGAHSATQLDRCSSMATQAESAKILEIAFAAAFDYRDDMVGIPQ